MSEPKAHRPDVTERLAKVLRGYGETAGIFCERRLDELFHCIGPTLLRIAERAEDNISQSQVFDAVGYIEERRATLLDRFRADLEHGIVRFGQLAMPGTALELAGEARLPPPTVSPALLSAAEREREALIADNIIVSANARCFPELYALSQRLAVFNAGRKLKDFEIPAGPHHLVHAFRHAIGELDLEPTVKLAFFALFFNLVVTPAPDLYRALNEVLKSNGILPRIKPITLRPQRRSRSSLNSQDGQNGATTGKDEPGEEIFATMSALLTVKRPPPAILLAQRPVAAVAAGDIAAIATVEKIGSATRSNQVENDWIELIGRLFEEMLNDPRLPDNAKAILSYLHTPFLKLARRDPTLTRNAEHPARRLWADLLDAGRRWIDPSDPRAGIFPAMERIVDRVLTETLDDTLIFENLHRAFRQSMEQQRRAVPLGQQVLDAIDNLDRARVVQAKQRATRALQALLECYPLPPPVRVFLDGPWFDLLVLVQIDSPDGSDGAAWREALDTAGQLVKLFDPRLNTGESHARLRTLPRLRRRIANGIERLGSHNRAVVAALQSLLSQPRALRERTRQPPVGARGSRIGDPLLIAAVDGAEQTASPFPADAEQAMIERLRETDSGTWFALDPPEGEGGPPRHVRLSWVSPLTSTCLLVDRAGTPSDIQDLRILAQAMLSGRARVLAKPEPGAQQLTATPSLALTLFAEPPALSDEP